MASVSIFSLTEEILLKIFLLLPPKELYRLKAASSFFNTRITRNHKALRRNFKINLVFKMPEVATFWLYEGGAKEKNLVTYTFEFNLKPGGPVATPMRKLMEGVELERDISKFQTLIIKMSMRDANEWNLAEKFASLSDLFREMRFKCLDCDFSKRYPFSFSILRNFCTALKQNDVQVAELVLRTRIHLLGRYTTEENLLSILESIDLERLYLAKTHKIGISGTGIACLPWKIPRTFFVNECVLKLKEFGIIMTRKNGEDCEILDEVSLSDEAIVNWNFERLKLVYAHTQVTSNGIRAWIEKKLESGKNGDELLIRINEENSLTEVLRRFEAVQTAHNSYLIEGRGNRKVEITGQDDESSTVLSVRVMSI